MNINYETIKTVLSEHWDVISKTAVRAHALSQMLGKTVKVNPEVLAAVILMKIRYGKPYCPCRAERTEDTVCPCKWHVAELKEKGRCHCGLFYIEEDEDERGEEKD